MNLSLRAHYLDIEWRALGDVREIRVAPEPIEIERANDGNFLAETQVFHDLLPWVGLRLEGELTAVQPAFEQADGSLVPMLRVEDGRGGQWWIQNDGWDEVGKRHLSSMHRSMGMFTVVLGQYRLVLNNIVDRITRSQIEDYLNDFRQDLIWLTMGFDGATASGGKGSVVNQEVIEAIEAFSVSSRRVLNRPACQVREVQIRSFPARLRPNASSFRQYLRTPSAQRLPGRGAEETEDIGDNRYIHHMVRMCEKLAAALSNSVERHAIRFSERVQYESERCHKYASMTHRQVDSDIFDHQMVELQQNLNDVRNYRNSLPKCGEEGRLLEFQPGRSYGMQRDKIFFSRWDGSKAEGELQGVHYGYSVLCIPESLIRLIRKTEAVCDYYEIRGEGRAEIKYTSQKKPYREIKFWAIYSVEPVTEIIERRQEKRRRLEQDGWLQPITYSEKLENRKEARTANLRAKKYKWLHEQAEQASSKLSRCRAELVSQREEWNKRGVSTTSLVPMGVRFSQNQNYAACQIEFTKIMRLAKKNGLEIDALEAIDQISVLHASALYERWCLIKIISALMEDYYFRPEPGWQERLIRSIGGKIDGLDLRLTREDIDMSALLEVQPILPNGRRPDFRISFEGGEQEIDEWVQGRYVNVYKNEEKSIASMVMDSKFRTRWRANDLELMLNELVDVKNYGQGRDRVFILHPAPVAISEPTSPLVWGRECNYGEGRGANHMAGSVFVAPGSHGAAGENNLKRLLALQLQAAFPKPSQGNGGDAQISASTSFCVRCGRMHRAQDVVRRLTKRGREFWVLSCQDCGMQTTRTHCYGCNTYLCKNGLDLTYHRTVADQVSNVVCPNCGSYFDAESHLPAAEE